ncbi:MAG: thiamine phosphate synthase [Edaphobacter sp.]|uniref:thiamine phosphate synthase n=1 Tax=Edaphobacter sp. TaxID=1934404 RepID=UPI00238A5C7F|nr:thiamine phosphate synthase [Edaphobacter sp.]MDE1178018.1 thiamine phosphate synthase [Edaphobacter sp.]
MNVGGHQHPPSTLNGMLRCAITDRSLLPGDESQRRRGLAEQAARWAAEGIDLIQLREKDLGPLELGDIARPMIEAIASHPGTRLLVNNCLRAAVESEAHGVHLPSNAVLLPEEVRRRYAVFSLPRPTVTVSCHSLAEVQIARRNQADAILFAPVFGKIVDGETVSPAAGLDVLRAACEAAGPIPVYALGGVTEENAPACVAAGAVGIAGIRLFHK